MLVCFYVRASRAKIQKPGDLVCVYLKSRRVRQTEARTNCEDAEEILGTFARLVRFLLYAK